MLVGEDGEPIEVPEGEEGEAPAEGEAEGERLARRRVRGIRRRRVLSLFRRERGGRVDWLVVGLGNPGDRYARTRHNVGFEVANELARRWEPAAREEEVRRACTPTAAPGPGGPRVGVLLPQTYMNEAGRAAGPARGALGVDLDHVLAIHDEIDLPFGTRRVAPRRRAGRATTG